MRPHVNKRKIRKFHLPRGEFRVLKNFRSLSFFRIRAFALRIRVYSSSRIIEEKWRAIAIHRDNSLLLYRFCNELSISRSYVPPSKKKFFFPDRVHLRSAKASMTSRLRALICDGLLHDSENGRRARFIYYSQNFAKRYKPSIIRIVITSSYLSLILNVNYSHLKKILFMFKKVISIPQNLKKF